MINATQILQEIKRSVHAAVPEATLILYGLYARGDYKDDSDIDILVLLDKDKITNDDRDRIGSPLYKIELKNDIQISPLIYTRNTWDTRLKITPLYQNVIREGIIL